MAIAMPVKPELSRSELEIVQVVWKLGEARVRDVAGSLPADRKLDFFTVQTYLRRLKTKGYLRTRREGRADIYLPAVQASSVVRQTVHNFVKRLFDGQAMLLVQQLIDDHHLSDAQIEQLQQMLDRLKRKRGGK